MALMADQIILCRDVTDKGEPVSPGTSFELVTTSSPLKVLVRLDQKMGTTQSLMKIFKIENGKETYDNVFTINTGTDWNYFWKEIKFKDENLYKIYVYKGNDILIGSQTFAVSFKKENYIGTGMRLKKDVNTGFLRVWGLMEDWYSPEKITLPQLAVGELITDIDGVNTATLSIEEAVTKLKGNGVAGSTTNITIRDQYGRSRSETIARKQVEISASTKFLEYYEPTEIASLCEVVNSVVSSYPDDFGDLEGPEYVSGSEDNTHYSTIRPKEAGLTSIIYDYWIDEPKWSSILMETFQLNEAIKKYNAVKKILQDCTVKCCALTQDLSEEGESEKSIHFYVEEIYADNPDVYREMYIELKLGSVDSNDPRAVNGKKIVVSLIVGNKSW